MRPFKIKEFATEFHRKVREELSPAERKAILAIIFLLLIGAVVTIIDTL